MTEPPNRALLPAGLRDLLPPEAEAEALAVERLMAAFAAHGYERVKPPLLEFEEGLLSGSGAATAQQTFRLMDPVSQRMMGLRADMTPQVARIAATRLGAAPRPLRLCYAGQVLRVRGTQLEPERQFAQAGIELLGADAPAADAEVILIAAAALEALGLAALSVDLTLPRLSGLLLSAWGAPEAEHGALRAALDRKDAAAVAARAGRAAAPLLALLDAAGPVDRALAALAAAPLPPEARTLAARLAGTVAAIRAAAPAIKLTADPLEFRGFEYHRGLAFTLFTTTSREELGRGGNYLSEGEAGEPGTGLTLYPDVVLRALPPAEPPRLLFVPLGTPAAQAAAAREQGWRTIAGLAATDDAGARAEARRLGCGAVLRAGRIETLD